MQSRACISDKAILISTTRGIENDGFHLMSEVLRQETPNNTIGLLSGVNTVKSVKDKSEKMGDYMPIVNGLYNLLFKSRAVRSVIQDLILAEREQNVEFVM